MLNMGESIPGENNNVALEEKMNRVKEHIRKNRVLFCSYLGILCIVSIAAVVMYRTEIQDMLSQPRSVMTVQDGLKAPGYYISLTEDQKIEQKISMVSTSFTGFSLWFEENETEEKAKIVVQLQDASGRVVKKWLFDTTDIRGGDFFDFYLPRMETEVGDEYSIVLEADSKSELSVPVGVSKNYLTKTGWVKEVETDSPIELEEADGGYSLAYRILDGGCGALRYFYMIVIAIIFLLLGAVYFLISTFQKKERIFSAMALLIGSLYLLIIPPYVVPDEGAHFVTAYVESSAILHRTVEDEDGNVVLEPSAANFLTRKEYPDKSSYVTLIRGIFGKEANVVQESVPGRMALNKRSLGYVPQVLGLLLGRLLNMNATCLFLLGRVTALLWYCFVMFCAVRIIPEFGKNILFVVGLLPMTMQQVVSYNYDSVLLGTSFFAISYILYLSYDEEKENLTIKDYVLLGMLVITIVPIKSIYMPLLGLGLLIPKEKFGGGKKKAIVGTAIVAASIMIFLMGNWGVVAKSASSGAGVETYTMLEALQNPGNSFLLFFKTIGQYISMYYQSMIGLPLGWFEIGIPNIIIYGFTVLLLCSLLQPQECHVWKAGEKIWMLLLSGGIAVLILSAMMQDMTPKGAAVIEGVQGRYFLPILPFLLFAMQNQSIVLKKKLDTFLISGIAVLQIAAAMSVVSIVAAR